LNGIDDAPEDRERIAFIIEKAIIKMTERHAAQAPALRERYPQIFNIQFSIVKSGLSGLGSAGG